MKKETIYLIIACLCLNVSVVHAQFGGKKKQEKREKVRREHERQEEEEAEETYLLAEEEIEEAGHLITVEIDRLDEAWHEVEDAMGTYDGLSLYCEEEEYRDEVDELLEDIHHYDTLLYQILLQKAELVGLNHEFKVTLREIEKIENKYKPKNFINKLKEDCQGRKYLESNKKKLRMDVQSHSYDGKAQIIDNDIHSYLHHITRLVDLVDKHAHHLLD